MEMTRRTFLKLITGVLLFPALEPLTGLQPGFTAISRAGGDSGGSRYPGRVMELEPGAILEKGRWAG